MASPVGHSLIGVASACATANVAATAISPVLVIGATIAANLPDLDFFGGAIGIPIHRAHRGATHSLLFSLSVVLLGALTWSFGEGGADWSLLLPWSIALLSHVLLDAITTSPGAAVRGIGLPLFWPVSRKRLILSQPYFHTADFGTLRSLRTGFRGVLPEVYVLGPVSVLLVLFFHLLFTEGWLPAISNLLARFLGPLGFS